MRTPCLIVEDSSEMISVWEDICLVGEVGAAGVHEVDAGQS